MKIKHYPRKIIVCQHCDDLLMEHNMLLITGERIKSSDLDNPKEWKTGKTTCNWCNTEYQYKAERLYKVYI